jgi:sugar-specific transcriptional regulator TrmB
MKTRELLRSLGLSAYEADVYEALVRLGRAKVQDIARVVDVPRPQIYVALGRLLDKNLCGEERGKVSHYTPVAPDEAFAATLKEQTEQLAARAEGVRHLAELHRKADKAVAPTDFVQVLKGGQIRAFMDGLMQSVQREALTFFKSAQERDEASLEGAVQLEAALIKRGVRVKCLYEQASAANERLRPILRRLLRYGEQARVVDAVPMNMLVVDEQSGLFSLASGQSDVTVFAVTHPALVQVMRLSFTQLWERGRDLRAVLKQMS